MITEFGSVDPELHWMSRDEDEEEEDESDDDVIDREPGVYPAGDFLDDTTFFLPPCVRGGSRPYHLTATCQAEVLMLTDVMMERLLEGFPSIGVLKDMIAFQRLLIEDPDSKFGAAIDKDAREAFTRETDSVRLIKAYLKFPREIRDAVKVVEPDGSDSDDGSVAESELSIMSNP